MGLELTHKKSYHCFVVVVDKVDHVVGSTPAIGKSPEG